MPTLEHVAALAFRDELLKIANAGVANDNDFEKSAAVDLFNAMPLDQVEWFLKEAGFVNMIRGLATGGARAIGGAAMGVKDLASNAAGRASAAIGRGVSAIKATPGRIGTSLGNMATRMNQGMDRIGQRAAMGGAGVGESWRAGIGGAIQPPPAAAPTAQSAFAARPRPNVTFGGKPSAVHGQHAESPEGWVGPVGAAVQPAAASVAPPPPSASVAPPPPSASVAPPPQSGTFPVGSQVQAQQSTMGQPGGMSAFVANNTGAGMPSRDARMSRLVSAARGTPVWGA